MKCLRHIDQPLVYAVDLGGTICLKCETEPLGPTPQELEREARNERERRRYAELRERGWR